VGVVDRQGVYRLSSLRSEELADVGFSGGAVYSHELGAVVAMPINRQERVLSSHISTSGDRQNSGYVATGQD
jgi:hypothetical protein